jgi:hypothetical protein
MRDRTTSTAAVKGLLINLLALTGHLAGAGLVMSTPSDNQGAVGKAFVALGTSVLVYPMAVVGLILCVAGRTPRGFPREAKLGVVAGLLALVPFAFGAISLWRWHIHA